MSIFSAIVCSFLLLTILQHTYCKSIGNSNDYIVVTWSGIPGDYSCSLAFSGRNFRCSLGKNGVVTADAKREGDGCSPAGSYPLRQGFFRQDRIGDTSYVPSFLNMTAIQPDFGWCDDSNDPLYNQFVYLPYNASHENLWMDNSAAYDLFAVIGYNDEPIVPNKGETALFLLWLSH